MERRERKKMNEFFNKDQHKKKRRRREKEKEKRTRWREREGGDREFDCNLFSNKDTTVASKWNSFKGRAPLRRLRPSTVGVGGESNLLPQFSRSEMPRVRGGYGLVKEDPVILIPLSLSLSPEIYPLINNWKLGKFRLEKKISLLFSIDCGTNVISIDVFD